MFLRPVSTFRKVTVADSLGVFAIAVGIQATAGFLHFKFPPKYLQEAALLSATNAGMSGVEQEAAVQQWLAAGAVQSGVDAVTEQVLSTIVLAVLFLIVGLILAAILRRGRLGQVLLILPVIIVSAVVPAAFHVLRLAVALMFDRDPGAFTLAFGLAGPYSALGRIEIGMVWRWALAGCGLGVVLGRNPYWFAAGATIVGVLAMLR